MTKPNHPTLNCAPEFSQNNLADFAPNHSIHLNFPLILGSQSPRRSQILKKMGFNFEILIAEGPENYPLHLSKEQVPCFIGEQKWQQIKNRIQRTKIIDSHLSPQPSLILTADTMVFLEGNALGKPKDWDEAHLFLTSLSGKTHQVITALSLGLVTQDQPQTDFSVSNVTFRDLSPTEINTYIKTGSPFDKAGGYGIQDDAGQAFIKNIEGSYTNVIGLPIELLTMMLSPFKSAN